LTSSRPLSYDVFEKTFREYYPVLCLFARKYVADADECKDLVHNVFLNLWQKRDEIDASQPLKPYLYRSVHNRCLNYLRDHKIIVRHDLMMDADKLEAYAESADLLEEAELSHKIKAALESLPEKCRKIFMLNRFEGKKYADIAEIEGVTVKAVEAQMTKALKLMRDNLKEYLRILLLFSWQWLG